MNKLSEISIEVEQDLYDEVSVLCRNAGTSVEALTIAFLSSALSPKTSLRSRFSWVKKKQLPKKPSESSVVRCSKEYSRFCGMILVCRKQRFHRNTRIKHTLYAVLLLEVLLWLIEDPIIDVLIFVAIPMVALLLSGAHALTDIAIQVQNITIIPSQYTIHTKTAQLSM